MINSLLIKVGMLAVTATVVVTIGWTTQEQRFVDPLTDPPQEHLLPPSTVASAASQTPAPPPAASIAVPTPNRSAPRKAPRTDGASKVDLNRATEEELRTLPGIGHVLAQRMLERRKTHGLYEKVEDLRNVKGIGAKRFEKLRPLVMIATRGTLPQGAHRRNGASGRQSKRDL
jgi:competence protein ComEA